MSRVNLVTLLDFERPASRRFAFIALLVVAIVSPDIPMPRDLPAIRVEQILLACYLPSLAIFVLRNEWARRRVPLDFVFVALAVAMTITLIFAPITVDGVTRSLRDPFEVARVAEYWLMFRVGLVAAAGTTLRSFRVLWLAAIGSAVFGVVQYIDPGSFNDVVTDIWTVDHNLEALKNQGRVVGTIGNANYFGIFCSLLIFASLSVLLLRFRDSDRWRWIPALAAASATLGLVLSQSRTATFATLGAMSAGLLVVVIKRRAGAAYAPAIGLFLVVAVLAVSFVEIFPPDHGTFHGRFSPGTIQGDSSVSIRFSKWRSLFAGLFSDDASICDATPLQNHRVQSGQEPNTPANVIPGTPDQVARDEQRKADIQDIAAAMVDRFCEEDEWPARLSIAEALVPDYLDEEPRDPLTGDSYLSYISGGGFIVGANLEDPSDPYGPAYTLGTIPSMMLNASFEDGRGTPSKWQTTGGIDAAPASETPRFGDRATSLVAESGSFYQLVIFDFSPETPYTASIYARSDSGRAEEVELHLIATFADGNRVDPFVVTSAIVPASGAWTRIELPFETPDGARISVLQFLVRGTGEATTSVSLDGATILEGTITPSFPLVVNVDPATLKPTDLPRFADSPLIGVGPRKENQSGAYDNEYALFLDRYGILGTIPYVALWAFALWGGYATFRRSAGIREALGLTVAGFTLAVIVFNIAAGTFYNFQIMAIFWLLVGLALNRQEEPE